jgi:nucleoid DNA-binding protein
MKNISSCITYLLSEHDCVIIPRFGGFVVHYETAEYSVSDGIFTPPIYTIGFNTELNHNDGLLINAVMRVEKTDYKTAQSKVRQYAENIQSRLNTTGEFIFPEIGKLTASASRQTKFIPLRSTVSNTSMYGFSNFCLPLLNELELSQNDVKKEDDNVIRISISKRFLKTVACAAAIILLIMMISTPINNTIPTHYASIIKLSDTSSPALPGNIEPATAAENIEQIVATTNIIQETLPEKTVNPTFTADNLSSQEAYYIIVGSSPREQYAREALPVIRKELTKQAAILKRDRLFRIYVAQFTDKEEAETYLADFRTQHPKYRTAWLLSVKTEE